MREVFGRLPMIGGVVEDAEQEKKRESEERNNTELNQETRLIRLWSEMKWKTEDLRARTCCADLEERQTTSPSRISMLQEILYLENQHGSLVSECEKRTKTSIIP